MKILTLALLALVSFSSSCASIVTGKTDDILVTSVPSGARFYTNLGQSGWTPMTISIPDDKPLAVTFRAEGFEEQSSHLGTRLSGWVVGNVLFGGLIGLLVDVVGGGHVHDSEHVHVQLIPLPNQGQELQLARDDAPVRESFDAWAARQDYVTPAKPEL